MKINRAACIPLITHDPYFSVWSAADNLYEKDTTHWCGNRQKIRGYVEIDGVQYCFMGNPEYHRIIPQKSIDVTATATEYVFENEKLILTVRFTSPIVLSDLLLVSRPCTYVDFTVERKEACDVDVIFEASRDLVSQQESELLGGCYYRPAKKDIPDFHYAMMGRACQHPLGGSGDQVTIDWGYLYLASKRQGAQFDFNKEDGNLVCRLSMGTNESETELVIAYDDLISINYFGDWRKAYWTTVYATILDAIGSAIDDRVEVLEKAKKFDEEIEERAEALGGKDYVYICNLSYRQAVSAHKLILDVEGNILFLSKENDSNGCIGTVDVSYPSVPLFLLYNTEYVKGMLRPIFKFVACDVWEYDFAPHDVGRYPFAWGQSYSLGEEYVKFYTQRKDGSVFPPFYTYPTGSDVYTMRKQMPVEECGNMLILMAAVCKIDGNADFAKPYMDVLEKWVKYLLAYGADPGEQLCTDDFGGHLAHNVNLAAKAIMGIEAYAMLKGQLGDKEAEAYYHKTAKEMAADWEKRAHAGDHYMLAFGQSETWSMKYNLVWDKVFGSGLFSEEVYDTELSWYVEKINPYGTPLDSRKDISKTDWILWCASMAEDNEQARKLLKPVAYYLENTSDRVPFGDYYETVAGTHERFVARSVQGGIYMMMLREFISNME